MRGENPSVTHVFAPRSGKIGASEASDVRNRRCLKPGVGVQKKVGGSSPPEPTTNGSEYNVRWEMRIQA